MTSSTLFLLSPCTKYIDHCLSLCHSTGCILGAENARSWQKPENWHVILGHSFGCTLTDRASHDLGGDCQVPLSMFYTVCSNVTWKKQDWGHRYHTPAQTSLQPNKAICIVIFIYFYHYLLSLATGSCPKCNTYSEQVQQGIHKCNEQAWNPMGTWRQLAHDQENVITCFQPAQ